MELNNKQDRRGTGGMNVVRGMCLTLMCLVTFSGCGPVTGFLSDIGIISGPGSERPTLAVTVPLSGGGVATDSLPAYLREYVNGVQLAVEEIATWDMPVPLNIRIDHDDGDFGSAAELTGAYVLDPSIIGVVAYWGSSVMVPLSTVYDTGQKTLIASIASVPSLTQNPSDYLLRNIPDDGQISKKMSDHAKMQGIKRAVIYYEDSLYGFEMAAALESYAADIGINIVDKLCSPHLERELPALEQKWRAIGCEAVFLVSTLDEGVAFLNALYGLGFAGSVICSNGLDDAALPQYLHTWAADMGELIVCSTLKLGQPEQTALMADFIKNYQARYGTPPDSWAALGYDSVIIAARAIVEHNINSTDELSAYLRTADSLGGLYEGAVFDERGNIQGQPIYLKRLTEVGFEYID